jgi:hypothetical protein
MWLSGTNVVHDGCYAYYDPVEGALFLGDCFWFQIFILDYLGVSFVGERISPEKVDHIVEKERKRIL